MKRIVSVALVLPFVTGLLFSAIGPAQSAADTTPPTLNAPLKSSFTVGQQIPVGDVPVCGEGESWDLRMGVAENFKWTGSDASGYVRYDLKQSTGVAGTEDVFVGSSQRSHAGVGENTDSWCGGGNYSVYEWTLTAKDAAGNATTRKVYGGRISLTQDNGLTDLAGYATTPQVAYSGTWGTSSCVCWSQGGVHRTTAAGAAATITVDLPHTYGGFPVAAQDYKTHVGLVMHKGPGRGKFQVYVDGVLKATVDTYAATNQPRTVVWQGAVGGTGASSPTIKIVNLATPGRPRIDLDAVLTN